MNIKDYKCFLQNNFLSEDLFSALMQTKESYVTKNNIIVDSNKNVDFKNEGSEGWVRTYVSELDDLASIFNIHFIELFKLTKQKLIIEGASNPRLHGIRFYRNPESMAWHKDYHEDNIPDNKRLLCVFMLGPELPENQSDTFTVSIYPDSPGHWGLGFVAQLKPKTIVGHNQMFGHEFFHPNVNTMDNRDILTLLWYDE